MPINWEDRKKAAQIVRQNKAMKVSRSSDARGKDPATTKHTTLKDLSTIKPIQYSPRPAMQPIRSSQSFDAGDRVFGKDDVEFNGKVLEVRGDEVLVDKGGDERPRWFYKEDLKITRKSDARGVNPETTKSVGIDDQPRDELGRWT
jgi:hypothetical protein